MSIQNTIVRFLMLIAGLILLFSCSNYGYDNPASENNQERVITGYGVTVVNSTTVTLWITDSEKSWADVHYIINGGTQFNYRMTKIGSTFSWNVTGLTTGAKIDYAFTLGDPGYDTPWYSYIFGGATSTVTPSRTATSTQAATATRTSTSSRTATRTATSSRTATRTPTAQPSSGLTLVFANEGNDTSGFTLMEGDGSAYGVPGWGNNELQYYLAANASSSGGALVITAKQESYAGYSYTSWRGATNNAWKYGTIEARIALNPIGQGLWQAFWMLGSSWWADGAWPACGEIDIMEHVNNESQVHGTIHWDYNGYATYSGTSSCTVTSYHIYKIEWNSSAIKWYVDGVKFHEANILNNINGTEEFNNNTFKILLNFAVGGNWPGSPDATTPFPAYMYVDYVRVYQ